MPRRTAESSPPTCGPGAPRGDRTALAFPEAGLRAGGGVADLPSEAVPAASRVIVGVDAAPLTEFLGSCPPFDVLEPDELAGIVGHAVVERYGTGAVILDAFGARADELFVIWQGRVDIWVHPDRLSELADVTKGCSTATARCRVWCPT